MSSTTQSPAATTTSRSTPGSVHAETVSAHSTPNSSSDRHARGRSLRSRKKRSPEANQSIESQRMGNKSGGDESESDEGGAEEEIVQENAEEAEEADDTVARKGVIRNSLSQRQSQDPSPPSRAPPSTAGHPSPSPSAAPTHTPTPSPAPNSSNFTPRHTPLPPNYHPHLPPSSNPPSLNSPPRQLTWLIFGATGHLGRSITRTALERGDNVTAVGWDMHHENPPMENWHGRCHGIVCDVRVRETVEKAFSAAKEKWPGGVDVVVNCAGYGILGSCEDQSETDMRGQFETNVIGIINILQLTLPYFRERKWGRYIIFSSIAGFTGIPGMGPFGATKFAVEGLVESLMYEIEGFGKEGGGGVRATLVEPSSARRDEPDDYLNSKPPPLWSHFLIKPPSAAYAHPTSPSQHALKMVEWLKHYQPTSAVKIAEVTWELAHCGHPPLRLLMGSHAVETTRDRLRAIIEEVEEWKHLNFVEEEGAGEGEGDGEHEHEHEHEQDGDGEPDADADADADGEVDGDEMLEMEVDEGEHGHERDGGGETEGEGKEEMEIEAEEEEVEDARDGGGSGGGWGESAEDNLQAKQSGSGKGRGGLNRKSQP